MKLRNLFPVLVLLFALVLVQACAGSHREAGTADSELGLSKSSVFSTPEPIVATSPAIEPGENELLGAYFSGSPPSISHDISDFVPIKINDNLCLDCHDLVDMIGDKIGPGEPTPMPVSHYTDLRHNPDVVTDSLIGARFNCTQCHVQQTDAPTLVDSTYGQ